MIRRPFNRFSPAPLFGLAAVLATGVPEAKTIRVHPISGEGLDTGDLATVSRLFRDAVESQSSADSVPLLPAPCLNRECALSAARADGPDTSTEIVFSKFYKLGSKWIFSATILKADGSESFSQRLTALSIEDMEAVSVRMADALVQRRTTEQVASIDNISDREVQDEPNRRRSLYRSGMAVGYLFPTNHTFRYVDSYNFADEPQVEGYRQMIRLSWLNTWDFRNDLQLGTDIVWNVPTSIGADASLRYLLSKGDVSPFVGGGVGLHYVKGDASNDLAEGGKRNSGPSLNAQAGVLLFRTYDVNVMLRTQYQVIFNSDVDQGIAADVGVTFGNKGGGNNVTGASHSEGFGAWDAIGAGALAIFLIALLAN